jgi:uncharacterized protein
MASGRQSKERVLVGFGRLLRRRGLPVGTNRILNFCRAAAALAPLDRNSLYWAGRATLVSRPEQFDVYDRSFTEFFGRGQLDEVLSKLFEFLPKSETPTLEELGAAAPEWELAGEDESADEDTGVSLVAGRVEVLRQKSFDALSDEERVRVSALIRRLALTMPARLSRRLRPSSRAGRFDLRRTLRYSLRTQGEPFRRAYRQRGERSRPLVLVLDVSGSMSPFARALMQFGFAAIGAGRRVEVFCLGTRLTRVTRSLMRKDPDTALDEVSDTVLDWAGGTRIGESLRALLERYGASASIRGAIVVICSDGLERGDPELLSAQMERLARLAHRIVWVNPLKGDPRYEPLARGMAAALPHVDVFLPGHNLASLESLAEAVGESHRFGKTGAT